MNNVCEIRYGLYHIKERKMLSYEVESNEGQDFCNDVTVTLNLYGDNTWLTDSARKAEWVRNFKEQWYNSDLECPVCSYDPEDLQVIEVKIQKEYKVVDVNIPTPHEFYEAKYAEKNPGHWNYIKDSLTPYNIYELDEYYNM